MTAIVPNFRLSPINIDIVTKHLQQPEEEEKSFFMKWLSGEFEAKRLDNLARGLPEDVHTDPAFQFSLSNPVVREDLQQNFSESVEIVGDTVDTIGSTIGSALPSIHSLGNKAILVLALLALILLVK